MDYEKMQKEDLVKIVNSLEGYNKDLKCELDKHRNKESEKKNTVNILGTTYTIDDSKPLNGMAGSCDNTTKTIKLCSHVFDKDTDDFDNIKGDADQVKRQVLRHEVFHAVFQELGVDQDYGIHTEYNVNMLAMLYPKIKNIFKELGIED